MDLFVSLKRVQNGYVISDFTCATEPRFCATLNEVFGYVKRLDKHPEVSGQLIPGLSGPPEEEMA